jgi:integrase
VADVHRPPKAGRAQVEILEPGQIAAVLEALVGHSLYPIVSLAIGTGMGRGELLGLQWGDVDLDGATLQVKRSLEETKAGLRLKAPKTDSGLRSVALNPATVEMLRDHKIAQLQFRLAVGAGKIEPDVHVFTDVNCNALTPSVIGRAWRRVVEAKKLPKVTLHALRHSHVSVLIREGLDILTISRRVGHSKPSVTLDVYGHLMGGADAAAAIAIGKVLK